MLLRIAGILACLGLCGCLTTEIIGSKTRKHHHMGLITSVQRAAVVESDLVVEIEAVRDRDHQAERFALRVPLAQPSWPGQDDESDPFLVSRTGDVPLRHLPAKLLSSPFALPDGALDVPIHHVEVRALDEIPALLEGNRTELAVYAISFKTLDAYHFEEWMTEHDPNTRQQVVAITGTDIASAPIVILDLYEGSSRHWGWYFLAPLTVAADAVTWPVQLILVLAVPM